MTHRQNKRHTVKRAHVNPWAVLLARLARGYPTFRASEIVRVTQVDYATLMEMEKRLLRWAPHYTAMKEATWLLTRDTLRVLQQSGDWSSTNTVGGLSRPTGPGDWRQEVDGSWTLTRRGE